MNLRASLFILLLSMTGSIQVLASDSNARWRSAIMNDDIGTLHSLLEQADSPQHQIAVLSGNDKNVLMIASKVGDLAFVEQLLALGADVHAKTTTGGTAFMFASLGGHSNIVRLLHTKGVDVNAQGANGWSALTIAAAKGHTETLTVLLGMQADVNARDVYGWTPLMRAVDNRHSESVDLLLNDSRIRLNNQDESGNTALHHAALAGNEAMLRKLLEAGIDKSVRNASDLLAAQLVTGLPNSGVLSSLLALE